MARIKLAVVTVALALLSFNLVQTGAKASDDDDDFDSWGSSEEEEDKPAGRSVGEAPIAHVHDHSAKEPHLMSAGAVSQSQSGVVIPPKASQVNPLQGFAGGNVAGFNESCAGSSGRICNKEKHLLCSSNSRCACEDLHIYIPTQEGCHPKAKASGECEFDLQCQQSSWGRLSRCERTTGRCQCHDHDQYGKRETVFFKRACYIKKNMNEACEDDIECQASMGGDNAFCAPKDPYAAATWLNSTQICRCKTGFIWDNLIKECLKIADRELESECKSNLQCTNSPLGNLSRCSQEEAKCECWDPARPGDEFVVFYKPRTVCFQRKKWNDTCIEHDECRASISSKAECLQEVGDVDGSGVGVPTGRLTCQCPMGKVCPLDSGAWSGTPSLALASSLILVVAFFRDQYGS